MATASAASASHNAVTIQLPGRAGIPSLDEFLQSKTDSELEKLVEKHAPNFHRQARKEIIERLKAVPEELFQRNPQDLIMKLHHKPSSLAALRKAVVDFCRGYIIVGCEDAQNPPQFNDETIRIVEQNGADVSPELFQRPWTAHEHHDFYVWHKDPKVQASLPKAYGNAEDVTPVVGLIEAMIASMTQELFFEELIDNSDEATAGLQGRSIFITVDAPGKFISVEDNGLGLEKRKICDMAKPGEHSDKTNQKYGTQLGHYGFGFNTAAWWYGPEFSIESRVLGADAVNGLTCDKDVLESTKQWKAEPCHRNARPGEKKCFTRVTVNRVPEHKFKQFNEMNGFDKEHGHPMLLQKLADVYYMHLVNPVPEWFKRIDSAAALKMRPLKITFEIRDPSCVLNCHFRNDPKREGVARFELHGQDFCGAKNAIHRIVNPFVPEGKKNEPLILSFVYDNPGFNPKHNGIQSSVSSREKHIKMDLVFFYHPSESGRETNPETSEGRFPTTKSDYGLALHWPTLGRMLPAGELPNGKWNLEYSGLKVQPGHNRFPFMEAEATFGVQAWNIYPGKVTRKVFHRVRGIAFFSKGVPATEHKVKLLDGDGFLQLLPDYFTSRKLSRRTQEEIGKFREQLVVWSKLDVDFQMVKDTSIASQLFIKVSEKISLNTGLGHPEEPWKYKPLELPSRIEYPQVVVGGSVVCSRWRHQGQKTKNEGDLVMICLKPRQKAKSETQYGRVELLFCETERGECIPSGEGMLWKQITFREEEVQLIYFKDVKSLEKATKPDFKKYSEVQKAKQKATRLEFFNEQCVINEKKWIPKATGDSFPTNIVGHVVIAAQAFCSDDGTKRTGTQRQPLKDPFLGAKLEIKHTSQDGTVSAVSDDVSSRILYGSPQHYPKLYQWELSSALFSTVGEYLISVTARDHSGIMIATAPPAKLKITPGRPTTAIASWADTGAHIAAAAPMAYGGSSNGSPDNIKLIRYGNGFPSISVIFSDTTGNEVSCPSVDSVEVSIDSTAMDVTFLLRNVKFKSEKGRLLISADFLELTAGALQEISSIGVLVKVFSSKQEFKATPLKARVTTGSPEKLVLVWEGEPPDLSSIDPEVGLPKLHLQLRDAQDQRCILSEAIWVKYATTRNGKCVSDYVDLSSGYDQGEQCIEREPDEDDEDKQKPEISLDRLPFGARNCGVRFQAFKLSGRKVVKLLSTSREPVCCVLSPFTIASRSLCLDLDLTRKQLAEDVEVHPDIRAASRLVSGQSSHGEVTFSTNSGTKIEVRLFVVKANRELASTMSAELGIRYEDAEGKVLPANAQLGPTVAFLKEGKASFVLDVKSVSDSTMTAFCIITCSQIDEETTRDRLKLRLEIKPPKKAPHTLQVLNLSTVSDGLVVPAFEVHVHDFDGLPSCKSASGEKLEVRVKASALDGEGAEVKDSCIVSGTCESRVKKEGVATFSNLIISRPTDPLQPELGTQNYEAAVSFSLYNHKSQTSREIESVRVVKCAVTIKPNLLPANMELGPSRQGHNVLKKSDNEFEMNVYAGEKIDGLHVLILSYGHSPIELTALHPPQAFTLSCSETDAPPAPAPSDSIDWVGRDDISFQLPTLSVPTTAATRHLTLSLNGDAPLTIKLFLVVRPNLTDPSKLFWCISSKQNHKGALILKMGENWRPNIKVQVEDMYGNKAELSELPSKIAENAVQLQEVTADKQLPSDFFSGPVRDIKVNAVTSASYKDPAPSKSKHDALSVKLVAGAPHVLKVSPEEMTVIHCSQLPTITLTVADEHGNTCKAAPYMAVLEAEQEFKRLLGGPLAEPLIVMMSEGSAVFQPDQELRLKTGFQAADSDQSNSTGRATGEAPANLEGKLLVGVTMNRKLGLSASESICKLSPRTINVTVRPGKHPVKLSICSGGNQSIVVRSGPLKLESLVLKVIAEDGSDYAADDNLAQQARLDFQGLGEFRPIAEEGHLTFVHPCLNNVGKKLEQAGELLGNVYLQDIAAAHLMATLVAAKAAKLVYKGESELPKMLDCTKPLVLPQDAMFEVQDEFGNPATPPHSSNLTLKSSFCGATTSSVEGLQPVVLCGSRAVLQYDVKLITTGSSKAKSGSYQLLLQVDDRLKFEHTFEYFEDALSDEIKKLEEQLGKARAELKGVKAKLARAVDRRSAAKSEVHDCHQAVSQSAEKMKRCNEMQQPLQEQEERAKRGLGERNSRPQYECASRNTAYERLLDRDCSSFKKKGGLGLVAELGLVESEDVARLLGNVLGSDILNVVTLSDETITWMQQQELPETYCKAIALSNLRWADRHFHGEIERGPQQLLKPSAPPPPFETSGCLGYLVNLIYIEPADQCEQLRTKLWWPLLGNALVFTTKALMSAWKNEHPAARNRLLSLDGGDESSSGIQNFAPLPRNCYFLKGVGESGLSTPVLDPRWIRYKLAKDQRTLNERQIQQRSTERLKAEQRLPTLTGNVQTAESVVAQLEGDLAKQKQSIEDLERRQKKVCSVRAPPSKTSTPNKRQRTVQSTSPA